jgi:hypothetical protein
MFFLLDQKEPKNQENPIGLCKGNAPSADFLPPRARKISVKRKRRQNEQATLIV